MPPVITFDQLPKGEWVVFGNLPLDTTAETFAAWLREHYFNIDQSRVHVHAQNTRPNNDRKCAIVSFPRVEISSLINWAINGEKFQGLAVSAIPYSRKDRGERFVRAVRAL